MRKLSIILIAVIAGCSAPKMAPAVEPRGLYDILTQQSTGGANIRFYEILTNADEIAMLQSDENLRGMISENDLQNANFLVLNMGEKPTGGYSITVSEVEETPTTIIVTVVEREPEAGALTTMAITNPYAIVRINSKKPIEIK